MKTINVTASRNYEVIIGSGLLNTIGNRVSQITKAQKICIVSDSNVFPLYGQTVGKSLQSAGFSVCNYVFAAGEDSKNGNTFLSLLNFLAENQIARNDCIIALGGGVVGDLAGFAAACYLRGIDYVQVPTSLLAMVDSSVGGKTAIDLPAGKNLCGAFYQPSLVLCDTDTLNTLPEEVFRDGCAEVIKYGVLFDEKLFSHLMQNGVQFDRETVISRCVELKRDVVAQDELDRGLRMKLNLGHTIGHGIEKCSQFTITHGKAVAIGMAMITRASAASRLCSEETASRVIAILNKFALPVCTALDLQELAYAALSDKKRAGDTIQLIVPRSIGQCDILPTPIETLKSFIQEGL